MKKSITALFFAWACLVNAGIHTMHEIKTSNGNWHGRLAISTAEQAGYFTDKSGTKLGQIYDFTVSPAKDFFYGFGFDFDKTDFNVAYSVTLYENNSFTNKACVFNVTASGPGIPDIRTETYNDAKCEVYKKGRSSINFLVQ